jgi:hypothetical protein
MRVFMCLLLVWGCHSPAEALASPLERELLMPLRSPSASESSVSRESVVAAVAAAESVEGVASVGAGVAAVGAGVDAGVAAASIWPAAVEAVGRLAAPPSCPAQPVATIPTSKATAVSLVMELTGRFTGWVSLSRSM